MSGIMRWRDIQNLLVTEEQINLLAGLSVDSALLNSLSGFSGTGIDLNNVVSASANLSAHLTKDLSTAHSLLPNTIDGGVLANNTVPKNKLAFTALDSIDLLAINNSISGLTTLHSQLNTQVQNLYGVLFPSITGDIAEQFNALVNHIQQPADAHDSTAISFGNDYSIILDTLPGATQTKVSLDDIEYFKEGDTVEFKDSNSGPENRVLTAVDYNGGQIGWTDPLLQSYRPVNSAKAKNLSGADVQTALQRSLRNSTDIFTGRLTMNQSSSDDALVINKTGAGYAARFNTFSGKSGSDFSIELGGSTDLTIFEILDSNKRRAFRITDQGSVLGTDFTLNDRSTLNDGFITKQPLTLDQTWTLPNRSGYIGVGDLTFTELLKVKLIPNTKQLTVNPGFTVDYEGQSVGAWISMEKPSIFPGATLDLQARFITDNQVLTLGNKWQTVVLYVTDNDLLSFFYGPQEALRVDAITNHVNFIPSAYMKLAKIIVQGDGAGGLLQSSIQIIEDQRPFLTMGLSASFYDEYVVATAGYSAGTILNLPPNGRAGGLIQTYRVGKGQLEVYLDGTYQIPGLDYEENQGEPVGRIRLLKNININSTIRYRITFTAAAVSGGIETPTMQSAYVAGPLVNLSSIYGPISLTSFEIDLLLSVAGSINVTNKIYNLKSLLFNPIANIVGDVDKNQLYVNSNAEIIYHQYKSGVEKEFNILAELDDAKTLTRMPMFNGAGTTIPKGRAIALHPSLPNAVVLCDTSSNLSISRCVGVTLANIEVGAYGEVVTSGLFKLSGLGLPHNSIVAVDPRNPGLIVLKSSISYLPTDKVEEIGVIDGGHLIVDLTHDIPRSTVWKTGIAGEAFTANETVAVRFAVSGETRGRVYKADKANANIDQKFWAIAAVCPSININIGDSINLFKDVSLHSSELGFDDLDIGKPLYLTNNGNYTSWRLLNGLFTAGDAAIKIGMIEDRKKFIIDSVQMMGTAPGTTF